MSSYNPNIPQATDNPSDSQSMLLANFQQLNIQYGTSGDHIPFTGVANNGQHNRSTYVVQTSDPAATVTAPIVYCKTTNYPSVGPQSDLYMVTPSNNGSQVFQLTNLSNPNISTPTTVPPLVSGGFSFLPGGYIIQFGGFAITGSPTGLFTITYPTPFLSSVISVQLTANGTNLALGVFNSALNNFQVNKQLPPDLNGTFIAIGK